MSVGTILELIKKFLPSRKLAVILLGLVAAASAAVIGVDVKEISSAYCSSQESK